MFIKEFSTNIEYYLPVFIPFLLTIVTVLSGIATKRISFDKTSLLKIHNDLVIGLFSFIIWGIIAYQQNGLIKLNDDKEISLIRVLLLLFADLIALIIGLILFSYKWENHTNQTFFSKYKKENVFNGIFLVVTIFLVFLPIFLADNINKDKINKDKGLSFQVVIPYQDKSISDHLGEKKWNNRLLCKIYTENSNDEKTAKKLAKAMFFESEFNKQLYAQNKNVVIDSSNIFVKELIDN